MTMIFMSFDDKSWNEKHTHTHTMPAKSILAQQRKSAKKFIGPFLVVLTEICPIQRVGHFKAPC